MGRTPVMVRSLRKSTGCSRLLDLQSELLHHEHPAHSPHDWNPQHWFLGSEPLVRRQGTEDMLMHYLCPLLTSGFL